MAKDFNEFYKICYRPEYIHKQLRPERITVSCKYSSTRDYIISIEDEAPNRFNGTLINSTDSFLIGLTSSRAIIKEKEYKLKKSIKRVSPLDLYFNGLARRVIASTREFELYLNCEDLINEYGNPFEKEDLLSLINLTGKRIERLEKQGADPVRIKSLENKIAGMILKMSKLSDKPSLYIRPEYYCRNRLIQLLGNGDIELKREYIGDVEF